MKRKMLKAFKKIQIKDLLGFKLRNVTIIRELKGYIFNNNTDIISHKQNQSIADISKIISYLQVNFTELPSGVMMS